MKLFMAFNEYYPESVLNYRLATFKLYLDKTYFAWIGEFGDEDPFYYRIHSPVAFMELDFHCGSKRPRSTTLQPRSDLYYSFLDQYHACAMPYSHDQSIAQWWRLWESTSAWLFTRVHQEVNLRQRHYLCDWKDCFWHISPNDVHYF